MTSLDWTFPCRVADLRELPSTVGSAFIGPTDGPLIKERWERATLFCPRATCRSALFGGALSRR